MIEIHAPLIFVDTETTHQQATIARPWEIAMIRRDPDGTTSTIHLMVAGVDLTNAQPEALAVGRFEERYSMSSTAVWVDEASAADVLERFCAPSPVTGAPVHLIGSNPSYDQTVLERLMHRQDRQIPWHYRSIDLWTLTLGAAALAGSDPVRLRDRSYELSEFCGAERPTAAERHTALGDAQWTLRWWDALMGPVTA